MTKAVGHAGRAIALSLCLLLFVFITAEVGHSHDHSQSLQRAACVWCSTAHVATVLAVALSFGASILKDQVVVLQEPTGRQLLVILLHRIRPPPILHLKDTQI